MSVVEFGIACNRKFKTAQGEEREEVTFVDISAFGKTGELINQYFTKGKPIFVEGRLKYDTWEDKQGGGKRHKLSVVCESFQFIGGRDGGGGEGGAGGYRGAGGGSSYEGEGGGDEAPPPPRQSRSAPRPDRPPIGPPPRRRDRPPKRRLAMNNSLRKMTSRFNVSRRDPLIPSTRHPNYPQLFTYKVPMPNVKLLLKESIKNVGRVGDVVEVSPGYARNYLIPKDLAVEPTPSNLKQRRGPPPGN